MKKLILGLILAIFTALPAFAADPVQGIWKTQVDDGAYAYIDIQVCGTTLCGVITRTFNSSGEYQSENIGRQLVWNMSPNGSGRYSGGTIWQPSTDKEFKSKMVLNGDILKVSGCVAFICKKQTWTRVQ